MRAILINPYDRTITELLDHSSWPIEKMYKTLDCNLVTALRITKTDILWGDDNGFVFPGHPVFSTPWYPGPLCGKCLILGTTTWGKEIATEMPLNDVKNGVEWTDLESSGRFQKATTTEGPQSVVIRIGSPILQRRIEREPK